MAYISTLSAGLTYPILQNVIYALPPKKIALISDTALEQNVVSGTTGWTALVVANSTVETSAPFVRCTTGNAVVSVKYIS